METAKRELEEETGVVGKQWFDLGKIVTAPGYCNEVLYLFAVKQLDFTMTNFDDEEQIETHWLDISEVDLKIQSGEINDAKTLSLFYKLRSHSEFQHIWQ